MGIHLEVILIPRKLDFTIAREKTLDLLNRAQLGFVHVDDHPVMINPNANPSKLTLQAQSSLEIRHPLRLIPRWTRLPGDTGGSLL